MKLQTLTVLAAAAVASAVEVSYSRNGDTVFRTTSGNVVKNTAANRHKFVASSSTEAVDAVGITGDFTTSDGDWTAASNQDLTFSNSHRAYTFPGTCQCGSEEPVYCGGQGTGLCGYLCNQDQEGGFTDIGSPGHTPSDRACAQYCDNTHGCVAWIRNPQATISNCWLSSTKPSGYGPGKDGQRNTGLASSECP